MIWKGRTFEAMALAVMGAGVLMVCQPWAHALFRWGFAVTIIGIVLFMVAAHLPSRPEHP
jgi:hypothetical protein